ncbi:MAG: hypothetical protein KAS38_01975 [Anaerolineales bacterium]|nr:hypothetical protein [Anaerolineales bacterium]MCK5314379.1 hypothetical protein [Anaerolineales bacterium]
MRNEQSKQKTRSAGLIWFIIGLALILSDNSGGWLFFILGLSYWAGTTESGESWSRQNPKLARWLIFALTAITVLIVIVLLIIKRK